MRKLYIGLGIFIVVIYSIAFINIANAQDTCGYKKYTCGVTSEQSDCVVKKRCNKEIAKLLRKIKRLEANNDKLTQSLLKKKTPVFKEVKPRLNNVSLLLGKAPTGNLKVNHSEIRTESKETAGLRYQRRNCLGKLSCGGQIQTNKTVMGSVGIDF